MPTTGPLWCLVSVSYRSRGTDPETAVHGPFPTKDAAVAWASSEGPLAEHAKGPEAGLLDPAVALSEQGAWQEDPLRLFRARRPAPLSS